MVNESHGNAAPPLGLLRFRGAEVRKFLQGQLSNDMTLLTAERITLAGYHNPQGRVLALLRLVAPDPEQVIALLPAELAELTAAALRRFVLRAKVQIGWDCSPAANAAVARELPVLAPLFAPEAHAHNLAAGLPQVYGATSGLFVAQMLNLDCIDAISFTKGCYTGQEIVARAHYRGRIKRRMQRFLSAEVGALAPGQALTLSDGRTAQIVDAVQRPEGQCEFLAVAPMLLPPAASAQSPLAAAQPASARLACSPLPLPYVLPE